MKTKLLTVLVALVVAMWWCWKPAPSKHENLPRWPLAFMSEVA